MTRRITMGLLAILLITGCTQKSNDTTTHDQLLDTTGAISGIVATVKLTIQHKEHYEIIRPSASLGLYATLHLAQGAFLQVQTAKAGIEAQQKLLIGQMEPESSETFSLLKEFGIILQVDIADMLNRSTDRQEALERYERSLANITELAQRKERELAALEETLRTQQKEQRNTVRALQKAINDALKAKEYEVASAKQEENTSANAKLAETETRLEQTNDIQKIYRELLEIAEKRQRALAENRKILIAGLKVMNVPGVEELGILEKEGFLSRFTTGGSNTTSQPTNTRFGTIPGNR